MWTIKPQQDNKTGEHKRIKSVMCYGGKGLFSVLSKFSGISTALSIIL